MKKTLIAGIALLGAMGMAQAASPANLIENGSFEATAIGDAYITLNAGSSSIANWNIASGSLDLIRSYWQAQDGSQSLDMSGAGSNGVLSQSFSTAVGQLYNVSFWVAGNPDGGAQIKSGLVSVGAQSQAISFDSTGKTRSNMGWMQETFSFVADGGSSTLSFAGMEPGAPSWGYALDNVTVTAAVPEPETYAMLLAGLGLMGAVSRRRNKKQA